MWNFHRLLTQAGFEHAETSTNQFLTELSGLKRGGMSREHAASLEKAVMTEQAWRVHRYRLKEWSDGMESLNKRQKEDLIDNAFNEFKKRNKDKPEIQNTIYLRYEQPPGKRRPEFLHEYIVLERKPGLIGRIQRFLAIGKWN